MFLPARDLMGRALTDVPIPVGAIAPSIPIASGRDKLTVVIFLYGEAPTPRARVVFPPSYLIHLDPVRGDILSQRCIHPKEIGPDAPLERPLPRHPDERRLKDPDAHWLHYAELMESFHEAWWAFAQGRARFSSDERARIVRTLGLFEEVAEKRVLAWYEGSPRLCWRGCARSAREDRRSARRDDAWARRMWKALASTARAERGRILRSRAESALDACARTMLARALPRAGTIRSVATRQL